ncbi:hypothetical protein [Sorangium sp. So ce426]|uniref:hypothetical protein n=1 Tax=unclassified Sorangium TaxID=2621164 RepID=UPI003F5C8631
MMDKRCFAFKQNHDRADCHKSARASEDVVTWSLGYVARAARGRAPSDRGVSGGGHEANAPPHTIAPRSWIAEERA